MNDVLWALLDSATNVAVLGVDAAAFGGRGYRSLKQVVTRRSSERQHLHENAELVARHIVALEEAVRQGLGRAESAGATLLCQTCREARQTACPLLDRLAEADHA